MEDSQLMPPSSPIVFMADPIFARGLGLSRSTGWRGSSASISLEGEAGVAPKQARR
jgi:hypothetical protein